MKPLQEYLKRYTSDADKQKKKKKKKSKASTGGALTIVDADPVWQKEVKDDSSESESEKEDAPLVIEDVEFKRMQRLEALRMRPYLAMAADGSGWVSLNDNENQGLETHDMGLKKPMPEDGMDADLSLSPQKKERGSSSPRTETDLSPPRSKQDLSPPRKGRHDSPELILPREGSSPPQKGSRRRRYDSPESSPPSQDLSPPRKPLQRGHQGSSNTNPPGQDLSPPRRASVRGHRDSPDVNTRRRDLSPPRRRESKTGRHDSPESGLGGKGSAKREQEHVYKGDTDLSPRRRRTCDSFGAKDLPIYQRKEIMGDGTAAGLQSGRELAKETMMKKKSESKRVKELDISISGRNANTVYRDKHGKRLEGVEEILKLQQAEEPKKEEKPLEWGKGLVQKREAESQLAELEAEKAKPFARTRDDLDAMLRDQIRWGDPMAHLVKKKVAEPILTDLGASDQMKESGFVVPQEIPAHSWMKRGIVPPPNRYGIKPGRHWDGVDRSTGYERDMYKRQNERKAEQEEAYLWSVADM
ncbi:hypothetical protein GOP47_0018898 [Adiantum capillus-veneris]|uniref:BUD13 homolog n=1 Tax=Adiantum capillus-veneris TaxID=13818 RepID=A0A9D4UE27_ADICA|nr:hypothetical protein GOP47_0018898 [Adiantum capillus-veneris]